MKTKKILIVNNSKDVLTKLSKDFQAEGMEVTTTTEIEQAKWAVNNTIFDVVLASIHWEDLLGRIDLEFLRYVHEKSQGTKVIIMSEYGAEEVGKATFEKGNLLLHRQAL